MTEKTKNIIGWVSLIFCILFFAGGVCFAIWGTPDSHNENQEMGVCVFVSFLLAPVAMWFNPKILVVVCMTVMVLATLGVASMVINQIKDKEKDV